MFISKSVFFALAGAGLAHASFDKMGLYEPSSLVTDHANLDRDLEVIEVLTDAHSATTFSQAREVYEKGGYSKSVATVTLPDALGFSVPVGTGVQGLDEEGNVALLMAFAAASEGANSIELQYLTTEASGTTCNVGGLVDKVTTGCLAATGLLTIEGGTTPVNYTYSALDATRNERTLQGFSTNWQEKMIDTQTKKPYKHFQIFSDYYGSMTYADDWVTGALAGSPLSLSNFSADLSAYELESRAEIVVKAIGYMSVAMYVLRELEDAIDECEEKCATCADDGGKSLDEAAAYYAGSLVAEGGGVFMYTLALKRCVNFGTCGREGGSTDVADNAKVNYEITEEFEKIKAALLAQDCTTAYTIKDRIAQLFTIPLIQGTLRYAYITGVQPEGTEKAEAEGVAFAASVLPWINTCSAESATTIAENMRQGQANTADYAAVKKAFENTYKCLGISCADVGGYLDDVTGNYYEGAQPCNSSGGSILNSLSFIGSAFTVAVLAFFI